MKFGVINEVVYEHFVVNDDFGTLITGVDATAISINIYDPSGNEVSSQVDANIIELGNGAYRLNFTPNTLGGWFILITNFDYFPYGKIAEIQVYNSDLSDIYNNVIKTLGLVHHNIYIDYPTYDDTGNLIQARLRIYSNKDSVGTDNDVIETYLIKSETQNNLPGQFTYWKQVVV